MRETVRLFKNDLNARFVERPNRFLIIAESDGKKLACHCPNPGRMAECLFPGVELILEKRTWSADASKHGKNVVRKTAWIAAAIRYKGNIAPLYAFRTNIVVRELILKKIIPELRDVYPEFSMGGSRFDFLCIDQKGRRHLVEVKACSLVEYGTAMFPDAPSERALRHLEKLDRLSQEGFICHALFVILHGEPKVFIPNLHTDPAFASALYRFGSGNRPSVAVHGALIHCGDDGEAELVSTSVKIDLRHGQLAGMNSGNYLVLLELPLGREIEAGALGPIYFKKGWYVYSGSARKNLSTRLGRHMRKIKKRKHWHLDYITPYAEKIEGFPIASYRNLECDLAASLQKIGGEVIPGFGSSDCGCGGHFFYFPGQPFLDPAFRDLFFYYRHERFS
ncbi:MAG: DNA/RNA nuclease SfsA [Treponema sp.]|jgi:sugar fermentation stimulation protein A|nr:DNA/RNA nuclease SfsA [Treponema sp.]